MYINTNKRQRNLQERITINLPGQPVLMLFDSRLYLDVPVAPNARTAVMAPKTICTQEPLMNAPKRYMTPSEQMAKLNNLI
jgi:hypothetical protein